MHVLIQMDMITTLADILKHTHAIYTTHVLIRMDMMTTLADILYNWGGVRYKLWLAIAGLLPGWSSNWLKAQTDSGLKDHTSWLNPAKGSTRLSAAMVHWHWISNLHFRKNLHWMSHLQFQKIWQGNAQTKKANGMLVIRSLAVVPLSFFNLRTRHRSIASGYVMSSTDEMWWRAYRNISIHARGHAKVHSERQPLRALVIMTSLALKVMHV